MYQKPQLRLLEFIPLAASALFCFAWLNPNHYAPWTAFHADLLASCALLLFLIYYFFSQKNLNAPLIWVFTTSISLIPIIQFATGLIYFFGDAWIAFLYLFGFASSILIGYQSYKGEEIQRSLFFSITLAAIFSFGLALNQWLISPITNIFIVDTPPHGRPTANLAQPNQLATLLMCGLVGCIYFYEKYKISKSIFITLSCLFFFGAALTQSRAAWIEAIAIAISFSLIYIRNKFRFRIKIFTLTLIFIFFTVSVIFLPNFNEWLLLSNRSLEEQLSKGTRLIHWATVWDAILLRPWTGFGWNQVSVGISQTALQHPASHELIEHSHNIILDILSWNGLVLGAIIIFLCTSFLAITLAKIKSSDEAVMMMLIIVLLAHSLVEFPMEYAYFLFPLGIFIGRLHFLQKPNSLLKTSRPQVLVLLLTSITALIITTNEYLAIEQETRNLRMESQNIGPPLNVGDNLKILLLTQQSNFIEFAVTEAQRDLSAEKIDWMRRISERYGYPPVLFRYALASGLNGQPDNSLKALARLCKLHSNALCLEARDNWIKMGSKYPEINEIHFPQQ